jgi:hypothetical protein
LRKLRKWTIVLLSLSAFAALAVTIVKTLPHPSSAPPITLDDIGLMMPDAPQTALVAALVRERLAHQATPAPSAAAPACSAPNPPHPWDSTQRANATTIVAVGVVLAIPQRGEIVALATAMQESQLYNLGNLGANNNRDSLGLFQQRPSMGWGSPAQVSDPVYASTAFYLALQRVSGWKTMSVTNAAQSVQHSAFRYAYAKWETDATALTQQIMCLHPMV